MPKQNKCYLWIPTILKSVKKNGESTIFIIINLEHYILDYFFNKKDGKKQ